MTLPDAWRQLRYWRKCPPTHELLALMARVFTTWKPHGEVPVEDAALPASDLPEFEE